MKKIRIFSLLIVIMLALSCITAFAEIDAVYDDAPILTDDEYVELSERLDKIRQKYQVDVAVVITEELLGDTAMEAADDIYDYNGFGMGENDDGILFYISTDEREYWFSTHAYGMEVFNDNGIRYLKETVTPYLKSGDYYEACEAYADKAEELLEMARNGKPYNKKPLKTIAIAYLAAIGGSLIIAFAMTFAKLKKMKTAVKQEFANNYVKPGSMQMAFSRDVFLYSHTARREKPKSNSSSGHTSSSGRTHGGGGGSF